MSKKKYFTANRQTLAGLKEMKANRIKRKDSGSSLESDFELAPLINAECIDSDDLSESNNYEMFELYKGAKKVKKVAPAPPSSKVSGIPGETIISQAQRPASPVRR